MVEISDSGKCEVDPVVGLLWELVDRRQVLAELGVHFLHVWLHRVAVGVMSGEMAILGIGGLIFVAIGVELIVHFWTAHRMGLVDVDFEVCDWPVVQLFVCSTSVPHMIILLFRNYYIIKVRIRNILFLGWIWLY
jgi:hypothetical protein